MTSHVREEDKKIKVLNLYAGIGGNRKLWRNVEVTAVEFDQEIAKVYKDMFPQDKVVVADAKEYLLEHFQEFDFIWGSPPCPTHSRMRTLWKSNGEGSGKTSGASFKLPDMDLYSIIVFLDHFFDGDWVVENVISYYDPLITPYVVDNHYFWSNKNLLNMSSSSRKITEQDLKIKQKHIGFDLSSYTFSKRFKRKLLNNCVKPEVGLHVFNCVFKEKQKVLFQ